MKHSPEPWTYDEMREEVLDANGNAVCEVFGGEVVYDAKVWGPRLHANGRRIAALSAALAEIDALVLAWWKEHEYDVILDGDGNVRNVYDEQPLFVATVLARAALAPEAGR